MSENPTDNNNQPNDGMSTDKAAHKTQNHQSFPNDDQPEKNYQEIEANKAKNEGTSHDSSKHNNPSHKDGEQKKENKTEHKDSTKGKM